MFNRLRPHLSSVAAAAFTTLALAVTATHAGPLRPGVVPTDAKWVAHMDLEALARSTALKDTLFTPRDEREAPVDGAMEPAETHEDIWREIRRRTEFREDRDLLSVTLFNAGEIDTDTVLVLETTERLDEVIELLPELLPSYRITTLDGHRVHTWTEVVDDHRKTWFGHVLSNDRTAPRICILSENWRAMVDAIERLKNPPADRPSSELLQLPPGEGSILYVSMDRGLDDVVGETFDDGPFAALASMKGVVLDLRENAETVRLDAIIRTDTSEDLENLVQVGQGLLALGRMTTANDDDLRDLHQMLRNINLSTTQRGLRIRLDCPVETVSRGIEQSGVIVDAGVDGREMRIGVGRKEREAAPKEQANEPNAQEDSGTQRDSENGDDRSSEDEGS